MEAVKEVLEKAAGSHGTDGLANGASAALLLAVAIATRHYWRRGTAAAVA